MPRVLTAHNAFESEKLAAHYRRHPDGAGAGGDAAAFLGLHGIAAINSPGGDVSWRNWAATIFGPGRVVRATPGRACGHRSLRSLLLRISLNRDRRTLAAAVGTVGIGE